MKIREYTSEDKEKVIELFRLNTPDHFAAEEEKYLLYYLDEESEHYFVMEENDQLIGAGGYNLVEEGKTGRISWDFFHPGHRGKGLGSLLVKFRIEKLQQYETIKTIVVRTSQMAYRFYEKQGFELKETVKDYWAEGFDLYHMEFRGNS